MLTQDERAAVVAELAARPGHEKVRALLHRLIVDGLGAESRDIDFERRVPEVHGRIDALLGRTVLEFKSDLRRERGTAEEELTRYLTDRQRATGQDYVGLATDGADFVVYFLKHGTLVEAGRYHTDPQVSRELLVWLQSAVAVGAALPPDPHTIMREFGRHSIAARRALADLDALWADVGGTPEARLKRELWDRLLSLAYGAGVGDDALFLQHTYLAVISKAVAWSAMIDAPPPSAAALLHGEAFTNLGITGQSEPDFFDWVLAAEHGPALVMRMARLVGRFRLHDIRIDIMKALYESLIDPDTRHDLGEYYTPDWLAARMIAAADADGSPYRKIFQNGATLFPRRLVLVDVVSPSGRLPPNPEFPLVRGRIGSQDKPPWKTVPPPEGTVEKRFLRPVLLGESIAPFRIVAQPSAVIPWDAAEGRPMNAAQAAQRGYPKLAQWLEKTEAPWTRHKHSTLGFLEQLDYYGKLSGQFPIAPMRVVYTKSGTNPAACFVQDETATVDSQLYWAPVETREEAQYSCAILNSETLRAGVQRYQARGQWGARHFDKYVFNLPIPRFESGKATHRALADAGQTAADVAHRVPFKEGEYFTRTRKRIRTALAEHGVAAEIDGLTAHLLDAAA